MPEQILERVNECSNGGFILFSIREDGAPVLSYSFDCQIIQIGLLQFAGDSIEQIKLRANLED